MRIFKAKKNKEYKMIKVGDDFCIFRIGQKEKEHLAIGTLIGEDKDTFEVEADLDPKIKWEGLVTFSANYSSTEINNIITEEKLTFSLTIPVH